jgi:hypothetical protein
MGTLMKAGAVDDIELFKKLAQAYAIEGHDRATICIKNSQVCLVRIVPEVVYFTLRRRWLSKKETNKQLKPGYSWAHL